MTYTVTDSIVNFLRKEKGYKVETKPQEKSFNDQFILTLDDIEMEVESQNITTAWCNERFK